LLIYCPEAYNLERKNGTLRTMADFFIKNLEINFGVALIGWILSFIITQFTWLASWGLWNVLVARIT